MKHLYKTPIPSTRKGTVDRQVKSNPRNKLIHGRHRCGKGRQIFFLFSGQFHIEFVRIKQAG